MKKIFDEFQTKYTSANFKIRDIPFKDIFGDFSFYLIESDFDQQIGEKFMESQSLFVDIYNSQDNQTYFLICTEQMLIIIQNQNLHLLTKYFPIQEKAEIYFFQNVEDNFVKIFIFNILQSNSKYSIFDNIDFSTINFDIDSIPKNEFWEIIQKILLINIFAKSYSKTFNNRIDEYMKNARLPEYMNFDKINSNDYIIINSSKKLAYYIKTQSLIVLKKFKESEIDNLTKITHPLLPKFYGVTDYQGKKSLVIEYINGKTLEQCITNHEITEAEDKFDVLMHIMVSIEYLHTKFYAYRNLTPENVIIDHNKTAVLIDFDRTTENSSCFSDPDTQNNAYSFKSDVYSFGLMIYYILTTKEPTNLNLDDIPVNYSEVKDIIIKCTKKNRDERPSFPEIFCDFYNYCSEKHLVRGFSKAIEYFMFAAEYQNDEIANCHLGFIYLEESFPFHSVEKGIHYLTLAANQNNLYSQSYLGFLYLSDNYTTPNIDKAIHFLSLAANQNHKLAQYALGCIYFQMSLGHYDIEKAIHFFKEVSSSIHMASNNLGVIYRSGKGVEKDIAKSIDYFKDTIKQNDDQIAMFNLAHLYFFDDIEKQDISKALKLLIKVVKQDFPHSFDFLCLVVISKFQPLNEKEIEKEFIDIDKKSGESLARRVFNKINNNGLNKDQVYRQLKDINFVYYVQGINILSPN